MEATFINIFTGSFSLANALGTSYATHNQSGELTLTAGGNKVVNGTATVPIVADGNTITVDEDWIQIGGDDISTEVGDTNHIIVTYTGQNIYYANKVIAA